MTVEEIVEEIPFPDKYILHKAVLCVTGIPLIKTFSYTMYKKGVTIEKVLEYEDKVKCADEDLPDQWVKHDKNFVGLLMMWVKNRTLENAPLEVLRQRNKGVKALYVKMKAKGV